MVILLAQYKVRPDADQEELARRYDPTNLFHLNHNIPPRS